MTASSLSTFSFRRGTNISHWLSQSKERSGSRLAWFTRDDMQRIADWGFDHIRLPVDEVQLWDEEGRQDAEAFGLLDAALDWADECGLNVIVDLHILRSHFFNADKEQQLFLDPAEPERFADLWRQLSARLRARSTAKVAYELLNEPVARDPKDWNRVAAVAFRAIRELEPERTIFLGSNWFNMASTFDQLEVPDDPRTVLTFHFYNPMLVTHHQAPWFWGGRLYAGPIQFPGSPIPAESFSKLSAEVREKLEPLNQPYGRESMLEELEKPLQAARRTGLPLHCGEFGVVDKAPFDVRAAWYREVIALFDELGIGWSNWDYKGEFGIVTRKGESTGVAEMLLGSK